MKKRFTDEVKAEAVKQVTKRDYSVADVSDRLGNSADFLLIQDLSPNKRINSDWQFRCGPLPAGYAERSVW